MRERAYVVKAAGKIAVLQIEKTPACEGCRICAFRAGRSRVKVKARNTARARAGDTVIVQAEKDNTLLASAIVYLVPVALAAAGLLAGVLANLKELYIALLCVAGLVVGFAAVFAADRILSGSHGFCMEVVEIINNTEGVEQNTPKEEKTNGTEN